MDHQTEFIIKHFPFPICVTQALPKAELKTWIRHLEDRHIAYELKEFKPGTYAIYRELTDEEVNELLDGEWVLRGRSFFKPDEARSRKRPGPIQYE